MLLYSVFPGRSPLQSAKKTAVDFKKEKLSCNDKGQAYFETPRLSGTF